MKAMILAAGLGTRMRPLTDVHPKPLLQVAGQPLIDWALDRLEDAGCTDTLVNLHYLGEQIESHLKDRASFIWENPVLETGGGVQNAIDHGHFKDHPFYVCNADNLWLDGDTRALSRLADVWNDDTMDGLLLLQDVQDANGYDGAGDFWCDGDTAPLKRLKDGTGHNAFVFTGVQILHPRLFENAPGGAYSLNVLYDKALAQGRLHGVKHSGAWHHVGTPESLAETDAILRGAS
ncbi:MAG: nucleotidyltransferase family protein [Magnetovibrio sp.]|nr:nucleotidyltransferase family protein [Magnetovibrio sp.]